MVTLPEEARAGRPEPPARARAAAAVRAWQRVRRAAANRPVPVPRPVPLCPLRQGRAASAAHPTFVFRATICIPGNR